MKPADAGRIALAVALTAGMVLAFTHRQLLTGEALQHWLEHAGAWASAIFVGIYAVATVLFFPGSILTLAAGAVFGPVLGTLYSLTGATLGATLAFLIARHLAAEWIARKAGGRLKRLKEGVEAEGWRFVAFVRLVPLFPFNLMNYALGLTRIPLLAYVLASFVCMLPGALAYSWLGSAGRAVFDGSEGAIRSGLLALAFLAAVVFLPRLLRQYKMAMMITPQTLRTVLAEGVAAMVDVRDTADFDGASGRIPGARNLPLAELASRLGELAPWRDRGVVLICRTENRSRAAARLLAQNGFRNVRVVLGGMEAWQRAEYPLEWGQTHRG
jgi:uncharacterized membrane protein YdjX (TVP38/TMEM64 family)/rhodanese-related sulfurtransferase